MPSAITGFRNVPYVPPAVNIPLPASLAYYFSNNNGISNASWMDRSTNGRNATLTNGAYPNMTAGLYGVGFDGVNDTGVIASNGGLGANGLTIFGRASFASTSQKGALIYIGGDTSSGFGLGVGQNDMSTNGNNLLGLYGGVTYVQPNVSIGTGNHLLTMVVPAGNSTTPRFFIDGNLVAALTGISSAIAPAGAQSNIGGIGLNSGAALVYFGGTIFDVGAYTVALTDAQVLSLSQNL